MRLVVLADSSFDLDEVVAMIDMPPKISWANKKDESKTAIVFKNGKHFGTNAHRAEIQEVIDNIIVKSKEGA